MFKAIIFDFDYTLGDSTKGIVLSVNYALEQLGYVEKQTTDIKRTIGLSLKDTYTTLTKNEDVDMALQFAALFKEKADEVMVESTLLYEGVKEVLEQLKTQGYKIAIVTTKFHYRIRQILEKFSASELIDFIVGAEDVKIEKPDPEGLLWAIRNLDVGKNEVLYVGDSIVDAKTAENAKVSFAAVLSGTTTCKEFEQYNCSFVGNQIMDIYSYIRNFE
ncbi:MAG: HAD family hydrolase [Lachnospiraceae bacterium]|nr:HAD family hydrolase [Lachnospiraceae bacterium]